jgi:predicted ATPase
LAEVFHWSGQTEDALQALADGFAGIRKTGECWWEAELHRLRGEVLLSDRAGTRAEAEACFQNAIEVARVQQAKSLELRAAVSLGRFWREEGRQADAHRLVGEVYGWFIEGFI